MSQPRLADYLSHILEAIERIQGYTRDLDEAGFEHDALIQDGVIRNIEVIGEASRRIQVNYPDFVAVHPELPLGPAYQMRNAVAHGYFSVDLGILWSTVTSDLPALAETAATLLASLPEAEPER
ncbi:DUF86 domain-containing protein [Microbacterium sp. X-17]|uniref:HepT-like ribonuclease domain-containing protein n=1 Tax=Microbacterium sp. X-17 TaxID=3144404 RepID=UPI0031F5911E